MTSYTSVTRRVNQSGACSSSDVITSGGRKSETTMEDKVIVVVCGYPELYIHLRTFTKTGIHFATRLELPGRSPSHDTNSHLLCSEFHARMARLSCVNEASKRSGYYGNLGSLRAGMRHHEEFSVMGTPSLQPFLKSYWLTPVQMTGQLSQSMQI